MELTEGLIVKHKTQPGWGLGMVLRVQGNKVSVYFSQIESAQDAIKTLRTDMAPLVVAETKLRRTLLPKRCGENQRRRATLPQRLGSPIQLADTEQSWVTPRAKRGMCVSTMVPRGISLHADSQLSEALLHES